MQDLYKDLQESSESQLAEERDRLKAVMDNVVDGIITFDEDGVIESFNPAAEIIFGLNVDEAVGQKIDTLLPGLSQNLPDMIRQNGSVVEDGVNDARDEVEGHRKDGTIIPLSLAVSKVYKGEKSLYIASTLDITVQKQSEEQLMYYAYHDVLTGLTNRALLTDRLDHVIERCKRDESIRFAVLFLDIDDFKLINDTMGHSVGDELLIEISRRLKDSIRSVDTLSRLGGDEFVVLIEDIEGARDAFVTAERIHKNLKKPLELHGRKVTPTSSIGIKVSVSPLDDAESYLRDADIAMYKAKTSGKARHEIFDAGMREEIMSRLKIEQELRQAIREKEFKLTYQPIVSFETGKVIGFEALIRWLHPDKGVVLPAQFIKTAERSGLTVPIGEWVLENACRFISDLGRRQAITDPVTISINLSAKQLTQSDLVESIEGTLDKYDIAPGSLNLEVTENMIVRDVEKMSETFSRLRELGVGLQMDDFGTGFSSLNYLNQLGIDTLKIDKSFVSLMDNDQEKTSLVRAIMLIANELNIQVIAEGIETETQLESLKALGCQYGQGYFFSHPLEGEQCAGVLNKVFV